MPVYQEKNRKKGNRWYFRCYYTDLNGYRRQKESKKFATKKEAQDNERLFLNDVNFVYSNIYFRELQLLYLEDYKNKNKYATYLDTKNRIDKHISPLFSNLKVKDIKLYHFNLLKDNISNLNIKTKNSIITYLRSILKFGIDNYNLNIPVYSKIKTIPKGVTPRRKYNIWNIEEFSKFINVVDKKVYKALFILLYFAGLRIGEALALTWKDVNYNIISINKSCNKRGKEITTPKTSNSYREIDIPDIVINALKDLYNEQKSTYGFNENYYIFGGITPISRTTLTRVKDYYIKLANVKRITLHEFRHSHVTLLRKLKYDVKQIAERIGDTESTVIETYSHLFQEDRYTISSGLNELSL